MLRCEAIESARATSAARSAAIVALSLALAGCAFFKQTPADPKPALSAGDVLVEFKPTTVSRRGRMRINWSGGSPQIQEPKDEWLGRGEITASNHRFSIYIPAAGPYSLNPGDQYENASTIISVDADDDRHLPQTEEWFSSLPVRIGDEMFDVKRFDKGGTWLLLAKSAAPLAGMVVGRQCPPFSLWTTAGQRVTRETFKGKSVLIDVWSMT